MNCTHSVEKIKEDGKDKDDDVFDKILTKKYGDDCVIVSVLPS